MSGSFASASSEYVNLSAHAASLETAQGSVSVWFRLSTAGLHTIIGAGQSGATGGSAFFVGGNMTGTYADESLAWFGDYPTLSMFVRKGTDYYNDGVWHNAIAVCDASDNRIYVDGVRETVSFDTGAANTANGLLTDATFDVFYIAARQNLTSYFNGQIDDVRIYDTNKYINDNEAKIMYENIRNDGITTGLKARWLMDEQSDGTAMTSAIDISGNGYNGVPTNSPTIEAPPFKRG